MKTLFVRAFCVAALLIAVGLTAQAEIKRKRYTFDLDARKRQASLVQARTLAKRNFIRDYLGEKFAPNIVNNLAEDIDIALDPPDDYLLKFDVVTERESDDRTQVTLTVEGTVDLSGMISALVRNDVLSFGDDPPKVMLMPSPRFSNEVPVEPIRALIYDSLKQAGLRSVDYTQIKENVSVQIRKGGQLGPNDIKVLARQATIYNADFLVYVDIAPGVQPFSQGGYIADADVMFTIVRPNANEILGEGIISARGNGSSPKNAYNMALDDIAPVFASDMLGKLYQSIYEASDVITDTEQLRSQIELTIDEARPEQSQAILNKLKSLGARVDLLAGSGSGLVSRYSIEIAMTDEQIYDMFSTLRLSAGGREFKTPVVWYAENRVEIEVVPITGAPKKAVAARPKNRPNSGGLARNNGSGNNFGGGRNNGGTGGTVLAAKAKVTLKLRPAKFGQ